MVVEGLMEQVFLVFVSHVVAEADSVSGEDLTLIRCVLAGMKEHIV